MDKYHIYEEVGSGQHSQVFKGREKMDIEYVAIKRVEKSRMESIVKEVQVRYAYIRRYPPVLAGVAVHTCTMPATPRTRARIHKQ